MPPRLRRLLFTLIGVAVSLAALGLAFYRPQRGPEGWALEARFDFARWLADLPQHLVWWIPFLILSGSLPALRALVWGYTAPAPPPTFAVRYHAFAVGALVHNTMPARLGLLVTAIFAGRRVRRPVVEMLASLLVAKLLEMAALVLAIAAVLPLLGAVPTEAGEQRTFGRTALAGLAAVALLAVLLLVLSRAAPGLAAWLRRRERGARLVTFLDAVTTGVRGTGSARRLGLGLLAALAPVAANGLAYGLALSHAAAPVGVWGGWLLLGALTLGQFTPGLPVGTGVYLLVASWAARALGADPGAAAAVAVLSHAGAVLSNLTVGAVSALRNRHELRGLFSLRRRPSNEDPPSSRRDPLEPLPPATTP